MGLSEDSTTTFEDESRHTIRKSSFEDFNKNITVVKFAECTLLSVTRGSKSEEALRLSWLLFTYHVLDQISLTPAWNTWNLPVISRQVHSWQIKSPNNDKITQFQLEPYFFESVLIWLVKKLIFDYCWVSMLSNQISWKPLITYHHLAHNKFSPQGCGHSLSLAIYFSYPSNRLQSLNKLKLVIPWIFTQNMTIQDH